MSNEKKTVNSNLGILLICLFSAIFVMMDFIVIDNALDKYISYSSNGSGDNDTIIDENNVASSLKVDSSKNWVYDASYESGVSEESYLTYYNDTYYLKDIVVPYFNVDSSDAVGANESVNSVYNELIDVYKKGVNGEGLSDSIYFVKDSNYKSYILDDVSSTVFNYSYGVTNASLPNYLTYTFDLTDGHLMSFSEVYRKLNYSDIDGLVKSAIEEYYNDYGYFEFDVNGAITNSYSNYLSSVNDGSIKFFMDGAGVLSVIVNMNVEGLYDYSDVVLVINK